MDLIKISTTDKDVVITIPKELIVFAANDNPDQCMRVTDKAAFLKCFVHKLEHHATLNEVEVGLTHLHQFLDDITVAVFESGEGVEEADIPLSLEER